MATPAFAVVLGPNGSPTSSDTNLALWLDASVPGSLYSDTGGSTLATDGGLVALWKDQSNYGRDVSNGNTAQQPRYQSLALGLGTPALSFQESGVLDRANDTGITGNDDRTIITVWQNVTFTGKNHQHTFHMGDQTANEAFGHSSARAGGLGSKISNHYWSGAYESDALATTDGTYAITIWDGDGGTGANGLESWYVNGAAAGTNDRGALATGSDQLDIGSRLGNGNEGINGYVAEVIVYDTVLTPTERTSITGYLAAKYAPSPNLIQDGSFEDVISTGDKSSGVSIGAWTVGDPDGLGSANSGDEVYIRTGNNVRAFTGSDSITFYGGSRELHELFQEFDTEPGATYEVRFYTRDTNPASGQGLTVSVFDGELPESAAGAGFNTSVGETPIAFLDLPDIINTEYELFTFEFVADSEVTTLVLFGDTTSGPEIDIDTVGVRFLRPPVPEPTTATLAMLGLGGLLMRRRNRTAS